MFGWKVVVGISCVERYVMLETLFLQQNGRVRDEHCLQQVVCGMNTV